MMKNKGKTNKAAGKKTGKKRGGAQKKKELNPTEVLKQISQMVMQESAPMTQGQIGQGKAGVVAPYKFLLEMAGVFPRKADGSETTEREESLAETLLDRLGIPKDPVAADEYEKEETVTIPANLVRDTERLEEDVPDGREAEEAEQKEEVVTV